MTLLAVGYHYVATEPPAGPRAIFPVTVDGRTWVWLKGRSEPRVIARVRRALA